MRLLGRYGENCEERERMGVEPTAACSAQPATDFEDRGIHQDTSTPMNVVSIHRISTNITGDFYRW